MLSGVSGELAARSSLITSAITSAFIRRRDKSNVSVFKTSQTLKVRVIHVACSMHRCFSRFVTPPLEPCDLEAAGYGRGY